MKTQSTVSRVHFLKYLIGFSIPAVVFLAIYHGGIWSYAGIIYAFGLIPILEIVIKPSRKNLGEIQQEIIRKDAVYDWMVYLMVPLQYALLLFFLYRVAFTPLSWSELTGMTLSMGMSCGTLGINVAHELGHRSKWYEKFMAKSLLLTALYQHFIIEHNRGHHKNVATSSDAASAPMGMNIYRFIPFSVVSGWLHAWQLEAARLDKKQIGFWSMRNEMIQFTVIQSVFVLLILLVFGTGALLAFFGAAVFGWILLEGINYIEHYGLRRTLKSSNRYERVQPHHSWNSDHALGRLLLFELTRHSDHHYQASRPYQILRHFDSSPQLPAGYPAMLVVALIPPLWFYIMNDRVREISQQFRVAKAV